MYKLKKENKKLQERINNLERWLRYELDHLRLENLNNEDEDVIDICNEYIDKRYKEYELGLEPFCDRCWERDCICSDATN